LEGVGSGQAKVREFASATIWLDIEAAVGLERVLNRDGVEIAEEMRQWQIDEDAHFYLDQTRENSDFILSTYEIDSAPSPE
jgi:cytidylate kinase